MEFEIGSPMSSHNTPVNDNPNRQWLRMRDGQVVLHAYSAFYDDRETGDGPVVRIIVVAHKLDRIQLFCIYNKTSEVAIKNEMKFTASKPEIGVGWSHNGRWFREYVLFCSCNPHKIPKTVTIVTNTTNEVHEIFALQVEQPEKALVRRGYAVCPAVVHHHLNPAFIIEWLEMLNILGVNKVTVYNISLDEAGSKILHYYNNKNDNKFVELRQSPYFVSDNEDTRRLHQSPVINDCYFRNMYRYEKIIVMDLDEIITPRIQYTYAELLHNIEDSTSAKGKSDRFRSYEFRNEYYFLDLEGDTHQPDNLVTMFHRKHVKVRTVQLCHLYRFFIFYHNVLICIESRTTGSSTYSIHKKFTALKNV